MKPPRIPADQDLPSNASELLAAAIREACIVADIPIERYTPHSAAGQFAVTMLAHVPTGGRAYCVHGTLGLVRANTIAGRTSSNSTRNDMGKHHPSWPERAIRKAQKLLAVWDDEQKGRAA